MKRWDLASRAFFSKSIQITLDIGENSELSVFMNIDESDVRCAVHQQDLSLDGYKDVFQGLVIVNKSPPGRVWMNSRRDKATERPGHWREVVVLQQPVSIQERFFLPCSVLPETFCVIQPYKMGTCCDY